jgi:BASS family bile acid:Na+ symporter
MNPGNKIIQFRKACLCLAAVGLLAVILGLVLRNTAIWQPGAVVASVGFAIGLGAIPSLKSYQFTAWIIAAVACAMVYPRQFLHVGSFDMRNPWLVLLVVQLVMFGMGTQMSLKDFAGVLKMPHGVIIGLTLQFTVMPLVGYGLAKGLDFPPEIAAGIVLIGSCSSGLASNVMVYLSGGNLALSITLVACATLLAPILTPFWMTKLAGEFVAVDFFKMMMEIVKIVLVPVGAALLHDYLRFASKSGRRVVGGLVVLGILWLGFLVLGGWTRIESTFANLPELTELQRTRYLALISAFGFCLGAAIVGVLYHLLTQRWEIVQRKMPLFSMFGIVYFTTVTTAAGRDNLLAIGLLLFVAAIIHNTAGYVLGYWISRLCRLDKKAARTIAFEVGLQNGGMASGLAGAMGKLGTVGLAAAIFSPWMNISGSILANYWMKKPVKEPIKRD